jgi:1-acyl-sn-glycerol-3-phosphate acyltransferase
MTDEIMYELMKLSGQEYVDEYAQRAKGRLTSALRREALQSPHEEELLGETVPAAHDADED